MAHAFLSTFSAFPEHLTPENATLHRQQSRQLLFELDNILKKEVKKSPSLQSAYCDADSFLESFYMSESPKTLDISLQTQPHGFIFHVRHEAQGITVSGDIYFYGQGLWQWRFKEQTSLGDHIESYQGLGERWCQEDSLNESSFIFCLPEKIEQLLSFKETFSFTPTPFYKIASGWRFEDQQLRWLWSESYYDGPITGYGQTLHHRFLKIEQIEEQNYSRVRLYSLKKVSFYEELKIRLAHTLFLYEYYPKNKKRNKILINLAKKLRPFLYFPKDHFKSREIIGYHTIY